MAEKNPAGYYNYGVGNNMTILYQSDDWPPQVYRFDEGEWVDVGETFVLMDRIMDGDALGPFDSPPKGVPAAPK